MGVVVGNSCVSPSIFTSPLGNDVLLSKKSNATMKSMSNIIMVSKSPSTLRKFSCKLSENPTTNGVSNSKTRMEEYNVAMKRMMRNPYEYHHDLGIQVMHTSICCLGRLVYQKISDGAAALVLVSGEKALKLGLQVIAKVIGYVDAAQICDSRWTWLVIWRAGVRSFCIFVDITLTCFCWVVKFMAMFG